MNEINYNSGSDFPAKDWLELYNPGDVTLSLANWQIKDAIDEHLFVLPEHAYVPAQGYAVLCTDTTFFNAVYSDVEYVYGNLPFNFNNAGDSLYLYNDAGLLVDSLLFDDIAPWPVAADGEGYTMELRDPASTIQIPEIGWQAILLVVHRDGRIQLSARSGIKNRQGRPTTSWNKITRIHSTVLRQ